MCKANTGPQMYQQQGTCGLKLEASGSFWSSKDESLKNRIFLDSLWAQTRSISTCRQFLKIYEELTALFLFDKTDVTSWGSRSHYTTDYELIICRSLFFRRAVSLWSSVSSLSTSSMYPSFNVWIFEHKWRIHQGVGDFFLGKRGRFWGKRVVF